MTASGKAVPEEHIPDHVEPMAAMTVTAEQREHFLLKREGKGVPWYTQNAGRAPAAPIAHWTWGPEIMRSKTISAVGCGLTSAAMVLSYYGYDVTPGGLNAYAKAEEAADPSRRIYATSNNGIDYWDRLFKYGGARLEYSRGTTANGRYLGPGRAKNPANRRALFETARELVKSGVPCIARVDYVGKSDGHYAPWGDHFVVLVGVHRRGHLLINDPGRFFKSRDVGNGAQYPDLQANWLAEDPAKGTKKNGGYVLMRVDTITGSFRTATVDDLAPAAETAPPAGGTVDATSWTAWATREVTRHATEVIPRLLRAARSTIGTAIEKRLGEAPESGSIDFVFDARHLDVLVQQQAENLIADVHKDIEARIKSVVDGVKAYGFTPPVAIRVPSFLQKAIAGAVDGIVQTVAEVIPKTKDRFLDLAALVVPNDEFVAELAAARAALEGIELPSLVFSMKRVTVDGNQLISVTVGARLLDELAKNVGWIDLDGEGELAFLFPSVAELADSILAQALSMLELLAPDKTFLTGLVAEEDRARVEQVPNGRVRLTLKADAERFSPARILDVLNVRGTARGTLVLDFDGRRAAVSVDVAGQSEISAPGGTATVDLEAKGQLAVLAPTLFRRLWDSPVQGFNDLMTQLLGSLDGGVRVTLKGNATIGFLDLSGSANAALVVGFENRKAYFDFSAAGKGVVHYGGNAVQLAMRSGAGARFEMPAPHTFLAFWQDPQHRLDELVAELGRSLEGRASVEVSASTSTSIGMFQLSPQGTLALSWRGSTISMRVDARCATQVQYEGHTLSLSLGGTAGASIEVTGAPRFEELWSGAGPAFTAFVDRVIATLQAHARITVKAVDDFYYGPMKIHEGGTFTLELAGGEGHLRVGAGGNARQIGVDGEIAEVKLGANADVRFDLNRIDLPEVFRNPRAGVPLILRELPTRLLGEVAIHATADAGFPIDTARLHVAGGLQLVFTASDARLRFLGGAELALPGVELAVQLALDAQASANVQWDYPIDGEVLSTFWSDPERQLPALLDKMVDGFRGHARVIVGAEGAVEGRLPGALGTLAGWLRADAGGELIIDFWAQDGAHWVTIAFRAAATAGSVISVDSSGIGRITGPTIRSLVADPQSVLSTIASAFAVEMNVRLTYKDIVLRASADKILEAIQLFDADDYIAGLVAISNVAFVTIAGKAEQPLGLLVMAEVAEHLAGWT